MPPICKICNGEKHRLPGGSYTCKPCARKAYADKARASGVPTRDAYLALKRDQLYEQVISQGLSVEGGRSALHAAGPKDYLVLSCTKHGPFQIQVSNLKQEGLKRSFICLECSGGGISRDAVFARLKAQNIDVHGGLDGVRSCAPKQPLHMTCPVHGDFHIVFDSLKRYALKRDFVCPSCSNSRLSREDVFDQLTAASISVEGGLEAVKAVSPRGTLNLVCAQHGSFTISLANLKNSALKRSSACPLCSGQRSIRFRLVAALIAQGVRVSGCDELASRKILSEAKSEDFLSLTCSRHGQFELVMSRIKQVAREGNRVCPDCRVDDVRRPARLRELQVKCDDKFGAGVVCVGDEPYLGHLARRRMRCLRDEAHGYFETTPALLLGLVTDWACPNCRTDKFSLEIENQNSIRRTGGYIYVIEDAATSLKYYGLTTLTPERRFLAHQATARSGKSSHKPLYQAMAERPADFTVRGLAYFFKVEDLAAAERQFILENDSVWPGGYNLNDGGTLPGNLSPGNRFHTMIEQHYADYSAEYRAQVRERVGQLYAEGFDGRKLKSRIEKGVLVEQLGDPLPLGNRKVKNGHIVVNDAIYNKGVVATCAELGVDFSTVCRIAKRENISQGQAIEIALKNRAEREVKLAA